jgi:carbon storage regulator CsrA
MITRKPGQGIMIGADVQVVVTRVENGQVRLAVYAPKSVKLAKSTLAGRTEGGS